MKQLLLAVLLIPAHAKAESLLSLPGLTETVATYAKSAKAVGLIDLNAKASAGAFLPIRTLKDSGGIGYLEIGPGAAIKQGENFRGGFLFDVNSSAFLRKLEGKSEWYKSHVDRLTLPDIHLGFYFFPAFDSDFRWDRWRQYLGGAVSIRL